MATAKPRAWDDTRYIPGVALDFFKAAGKPEKVPAGKAFFTENEKARPLLFMRDKMYLLLDGEVDLVARRKTIGTVKKGQIFGEMASITHAPRSASAVAETDCQLLPIHRTAFLMLVKTNPDFAESLLASLAERLRLLTAKLK